MAWQIKFQSEFGLEFGCVDVAELLSVSGLLVDSGLLLVTSLQNASTSKEYPGMPGGIYTKIEN